MALGSELQATDNEGRTALHLAAGCGDKNMALKLVELGADINSRDSVGGETGGRCWLAWRSAVALRLVGLGAGVNSRDSVRGETRGKTAHLEKC